MNTDKELQAFCARVIVLCDAVGESCSLTDLASLKKVASHLRKEAMGMSKTFCPAPQKAAGLAPVEVDGIGGPIEPSPPHNDSCEDLL